MHSEEIFWVLLIIACLCLTYVVTSFFISPRLQEKFHNFGMTKERGFHERRVAILKT